jgi:transcription antitermination factor NusG
MSVGQLPIRETYAEMHRENSNWYALHTRYQHEALAARILRNKGFEVFLPMYSVRRRWQDRIKRLSLPLFPNYLFVKEELDRWLHIITTPGICNIVGYGAEPARIPLSEIERVMRIVEQPAAVEPYPFLNSGDRVRIVSGPLTGLEGILVRKKNLMRLVVSVEMLGKSAAVELDGARVERIGRKKIVE